MTVDTFGVGEGTRNSQLQENYDNAKAIQTTIENEKIYKQMKELQESKKQQLINSGADQSLIHTEMQKWDAAIDKLRDRMYAASRNENNVGQNVTVGVNIDGNDYNFEYKTKQSLHNMIKNNESRAGMELATYDNYKSNRDELETKLANSHKVGGKNN